MNKTLISLLLLMLYGCGTEPVWKNEEPAFQMYIDRFSHELGHNVHIDIKFFETETNAVGKCVLYASGARKVGIDLNYWKDSSEKRRELLIFHELGHCLLDKDHIKGEVYLHGKICPTSIMRHNVFSNYEMTECYSGNRHYYMKELFGRKK